MIAWTRYVLHAMRPAYEALGWVLSDDMTGTPHGHYAVLMLWAGDGEPVEPGA